MDIAERKGSLLRRLLRSADRLSERAIARGSVFEKTPDSKSIALLVSVTPWDHRLRFWFMQPPIHQMVRQSLHQRDFWGQTPNSASFDEAVGPSGVRRSIGSGVLERCQRAITQQLRV